MQGRGRAGKGFTLVEVMVTLAVLVIIAGLGYGAVTGLFARAQQNARDHTARALFMAAQSAMTHAYANDPELAEALTASAEAVSLQSIAPQPADEEWARELSLNADKIVCLVSDGGESPLRSLLMGYVDDRTALEGHILIEFNRETGNLLSCFYSDVTALSPELLRERGADALKAISVGSYWVHYTGARAARQVVEEAALDELSIQLVDYDDPDAAQGNDVNGGRNYALLTLECALPAGAPADTVYTVTLTSYQGVSRLGSLSLSLGPEGAADIALEALSGRRLDAALASPTAYAGGRRAVLFFDAQKDAYGRDVLVLVLDSQAAGAGIRELYAEIASGDLVATVSAESASAGQSYQAVSNSEHALFAGVDGDGMAEVASLRHLNNIRYAPDGDF
ncbi:MAG: type II secretion system protein, partial [Clostridia bacterium]|nr:type II secretion system protein [Clostridia bacterium]